MRIKGYIECGVSIWDQTELNDKTHYYAFNNHNEDNDVIISLCNSQFDTELYLKTSDLAIIGSNDDSDSCYQSDTDILQPKQSLVSTVSLFGDIDSNIDVFPVGIYVIEVTGKQGAVGLYNLQMSCSITDSPTSITSPPTNYPTPINLTSTTLSSPDPDSTIDSTASPLIDPSCIYGEGVTILPSIDTNTTVCDINILILAQSQVIVEDKERWSLISTSQNTWHLKMKLGDSWKFTSDKISTITFTIYGQCGIQNSDCDPLFAFSINDDKYFAGSIKFDEYGRNKISPSCNQPLNTGNVYQMVRTLNNHTATSRRQSYSLINNNHYIQKWEIKPNF